MNIAKFADISITPEVVMKKLLKLKDHKAPGPDNMYPKVLKVCAEEVCVPLAIIFRKSMDEGLVF